MTAALLPALRRRLEPIGLNLIGVASLRDYDAGVRAELALGARWPGMRSAIVVGSGGAAFWRAAGAARAKRESPVPDPVGLDAFAEERFATLSRELLQPRSAVMLFPHQFAAEPVSFVHLAACAGLGVRSLLGILIHPEFGPWFALRAAALVPDDLPPSPALAFDPCPSCAKPCVAACPGGAMSASGWDVPACTAHRLGEGDCGDGCHSRIACVYGAQHRYPVEELRHHQASALATMRRLASSPAVPEG